MLIFELYSAFYYLLSFRVESLQSFQKSIFYLMLRFLGLLQQGYQFVLYFIVIMQMQRREQLPAFPLSHLLTIEANTFCFQCNKSTKQWADLSHAIFLCLNCAAKFKELTYATKVKSIGLDQWTAEDVQRMDKGGNQSFKKFLSRYGLENSQIRTKILSKAAAYYRGLLDGKEMGNEPPIEVGRQIYKQDIPLTEMNPDEILQLAKQKAISIGSTTKALGEKGYQKIKQKYESGQLKEGAKKVATTVSTGAQWLWGKMKETVTQISQDLKK